MDNKKKIETLMSSLGHSNRDALTETAEIMKMTEDEVEAILNDKPVEPPKKILNIRLIDKDKK